MINFVKEKLSTYLDKGFSFDAKTHTYTYNGEKFISVTQFISLFHEDFDSNYWSKYKSEQLGKTPEEILSEWKKLNDRANEIGTATHNWIEGYFKREYQQLPVDADVIDRINKFNIAYVKYLFKLTPIVFEQRIFSKKWKIAGMIDSLFLYKDKVIIIDWKTNKLFTDDNHPKGTFEKLLSPFNSVYKNHFNEYSIQVSLYRLILKEIGIDVKACYLLHIGPDGEATMHTAKDFSDILEQHLNTL